MARMISERLARVPGAVDVHLHQVEDVPEIRFNVDRTRADQLGLTQKDVADSVLISLSSSSQTAPNYWINPQNSVDYPVVVQTPQYKMDSTEAVLNTPVHASLRPGDATAGQPGKARAQQHLGRGQPLQCPAAVRCLRQRAGPRPGQRVARSG